MGESPPVGSESSWGSSWDQDSNKISNLQKHPSYFENPKDTVVGIGVGAGTGV